MHCRRTVEIFFRVSFYWDLLQLINSLLLTNLNASSWLGILYPTNSLSCESHWTNLEIFLSLDRTRCSISVPPVPKKIIYQKIHDSCHEMHHSCHMQVSSILQQCMDDDLLLVVGDTQHHGSHHRNVLEEKLVWDQYEKVSILDRLPFDSCKVLFLLGLETFQYPSGLCSEEVALLVRLDGEHPSFGHIISRLELPHVDEIKNFVVNPRICAQDVLLQRTVKSILLLLGLMRPFVHEISFWLLFLLPFRR